jgi:hypothetical protein
MKRLLSPCFLHLASLLASISLLSGCAANFSLPDTTSADSDFGPIVGRVFGGHAPLVGAHVYVLQVAIGGGGIGTSATSLLGSGTSNSPGGYPLQPNVNDPNIPVGWEYVTTDSNGAFSLTQGYKCTPNYPVYIYAYGGAPSVAEGGSGVQNPAIVNLATLGLCPLAKSFAGSITYIFLNEVSTVATAYAFQGFTLPSNNDAVHIGYSGFNSAAEGLTGIQNAAYNTFQLYDIEGTVSGQSANYKTYTTVPNAGLGTVPQTVLDTLANILAACVDSGNSTRNPATAAQCTTLFATATNDGTSSGVQPTDTATAAINIARHPAGVGNTSFASTLFGIPTGAVPFSPNLNNAPPDFTVGIKFPSSASAVFTGPSSIATDQLGNFWFTTQLTAPNVYGTPPTYGTGYLAEGSSLGILEVSQLNSSYTDGTVVIDSSGDAWAGTLDGITSNIYEDTGSAFHTYGDTFTRPDAPVADNSTSSGNLYFPHGPTCPIPADPGCGSGANNNATLTLVYSNGATGASDSIAASFSPGAYPTHAAIDAGGYDWMTSDTPTYGNTITRVGKNTGIASLGFPINPSRTGACGSGWASPEQLAIDTLGNAWVPIYGTTGIGTGVFAITPLGACSYFDSEGGNTVGPYGAAVDGFSNVWITNTKGGTGGTGSLAELSYLTGSPLSSTNYQPVNQVSGTVSNLLQDPQEIAVDISGDVFVANFTGNSIVELIGLAAPVYGPLGVAAGAVAIGEVP